MALFAYKHPWTHCQSKSMLKLLTFSLPRRGSLLSLLFLSSSDSQVKPMVKNPSVNAGDIRDKSSIPGLGRSPGGGHGNPLQYSCLQTPTDRGAWWVRVHGVTRSQTQLSMRAQLSKAPLLTSFSSNVSSTTPICSNFCCISELNWPERADCRRLNEKFPVKYFVLHQFWGANPKVISQRTLRWLEGAYLT